MGGQHFQNSYWEMNRINSKISKNRKIIKKCKKNLNFLKKKRKVMKNSKKKKNLSDSSPEGLLRIEIYQSLSGASYRIMSASNQI